MLVPSVTCLQSCQANNSKSYSHIIFKKVKGKVGKSDPDMDGGAALSFVLWKAWPSCSTSFFNMLLEAVTSEFQRQARLTNFWLIFNSRCDVDGFISWCEELFWTCPHVNQHDYMSTRGSKSEEKSSRALETASGALGWPFGCLCSIMLLLLVGLLFSCQMWCEMKVLTTCGYWIISCFPPPTRKSYSCLRKTPFLILKSLLSWLNGFVLSVEWLPPKIDF